MATDTVVEFKPIRVVEGARRDENVIRSTERQFQAVVNATRRAGWFGLSLGASFQPGPASGWGPLAGALKQALSLEGVAPDVRDLMAAVLKLAQLGKGVTVSRGLKYESVGGGKGRVAKEGAPAGKAEELPAHLQGFCYRPK